MFTRDAYRFNDKVKSVIVTICNCLDLILIKKILGHTLACDPASCVCKANNLRNDCNERYLISVNLFYLHHVRLYPLIRFAI